MKKQEKDTFEIVTDIFCYGIAPIIFVFVIIVLKQIGKMMVA